MNENRAQSTKESRPYFPGRAEAQQPLWSDNLVAANGLCGCADGPWCWLSGAHLPGSCTCGGRGVVGISVSGLQRAVLCCSLRLGLMGGARWGRWVLWLWCWGFHPVVCTLITEEPPSPRVSAASLRTLLSLCPCPSFFWFCFYLRLLCPWLRIWETTKKPIPMQTHEGLFTSLILCPSIPNTAEQGLGPRGGF